MVIDRSQALERFKAYTSHYDPQNHKIALKIDHSLRTAALSERIAQSLDLSAEDVDLAWLCGLLHDIGRFEQIRRWNTFSDAKSTSHAQLSVDVLFEAPSADMFDTATVAGSSDVTAASETHGSADTTHETPLIRTYVADNSEDNLIKAVVGLHGVFRLPEGLDARTKQFCDIIRDADKLDILHTITINTPFDLFGATDEEFRASALSVEAKQAFYDHRCLQKYERHYPADYLIGFLCFAYELVYPESLHIVAEDGYLMQLFTAPFGLTFTNTDTAEEIMVMHQHMRHWLSGEIAKSDPIFDAEQQHLTQTYETLHAMELSLARAIQKTAEEAAADKESMAEEVTANFSSYGEAQETYIDYAVINNVIQAYNLLQDAQAQKLNDVALLLKQPYFAKIALRFKEGQEPKELYLGSTGLSDESYKRLVVDWRSPVAEVYYNQVNGPTSYVANGRTINVDLVLRRQFDITRDHLNAYFDTNIAIQDELLLDSLSKQRGAHMQTITATIQKEQNEVIRYDDVPALLVAGIAGSGKTSVLLQRIAYLFYQQRETLDASEIYLITPNDVFRTYINNVLPDLGEKNPRSYTWTEFEDYLMPANHNRGMASIDLETFRQIDKAVASFTFETKDFKELIVGDRRLFSSAQIHKIVDKFSHLPAGPHLVTLVREEMLKRLDKRITQLSAEESIINEIMALDVNEQLRLFHETVDPQDDEEARAYALVYLKDLFAPALRIIERDEWLRMDRIGMRLLEKESLLPVEWLYLKIAITGMGNPSAKYVMVDEVQDYSAAQLIILARYFRRAHFLLLGDENQAIKDGTATFDDIREIFTAERGGMDTCRLLTSYRSSPEITDLFASLANTREGVTISSIQRPGINPVLFACESEEDHLARLSEVIEDAQAHVGLTAIIVPHTYLAKRYVKKMNETNALENNTPAIIENYDRLPDKGVFFVSLALAKGLEFDHVVIPDVSAQVFDESDLARHQLYTTISRATRKVTLLSRRAVTPLLDGVLEPTIN